MNGSGLSIAACLAEISCRLTAAAAVAKAALVCAEAGSEHEAVRIAMDLDTLLQEAETLHGAVCLLGRLRRATESAAAS